MPYLFANNALRTRYVRRVSISNLLPYHHVFSNRYEIDPPSPLTHTHVDLHPLPSDSEADPKPLKPRYPIVWSN